MGKKDTITKDYMSVPEHFADAYNYYLFDGKQIIRAGELETMDATELAMIFSEEKTETAQKFRDILKHCIVKEDEKYTYLILGIENQSDIHYAMPVKNMIYDALNYGQQVSEKAKQHRGKRDLQGDEFLSGFAKTDTLKPVITLVIYFGTNEWDAPRNLKEMFGEVNEEILQYVSDYKVNLLVPKEIEDFSKFRTDFGKAMKYIAVSDMEEEYEAVANEEPYKMINVDTARLLNECVGMKIPIEKGEDKVEVCKAVKGIEEKGRQEGKKETLRVMIKTLQELGHTKEDIVNIIMDKFSMTEDEILKYIE